MYHEFDYKSQKSTLIVCIEWPTRIKKQVKPSMQISGTKWTNM